MVAGPMNEVPFFSDGADPELDQTIHEDRIPTLDLPIATHTFNATMTIRRGKISPLLDSDIEIVPEDGGFKPKSTHTLYIQSVPEPLDCRSEAGVTVGLIDAMIGAANALAGRALNHPEVHKALMDFASNETVITLLSQGQLHLLAQMTEVPDED